MILDTNALTALAARDPAIIAKLEAADSLAFSFICVAEFQYGLLGSNRPEAGHELLRIMPMILNVVVDPFLKTISGQRLFRGNINFPWFLGIAILIS